MYVNKSGRRLVIGRLNLGEGDPVPGIPLTEAERKGVEAFVKAGYLVEYGPVSAESKEEVAAKETPAAEAPAETPAAEAPTETTAEAPAETKTTKRSSKKAKATAETATATAAEAAPATATETETKE